MLWKDMISGRKVLVLTLAVGAFSFAPLPRAYAAENAEVAQKLPTADQARQIIEQGAQFLLKQQTPDGLFAPAQAPIGMHALALRALAQAPGVGYQNPAVRKGYDALLAFQLENGGIYKDSLANYNTAIAISALAAADSPEYKPAIDKAVAYLKGLQWTDTIAGPKGEKVDPKNPWYGGWGYGGFSRGAGRPAPAIADILQGRLSTPRCRRPLKLLPHPSVKKGWQSRSFHESCGVAGSHSASFAEYAGASQRQTRRGRLRRICPASCQSCLCATGPPRHQAWRSRGDRHVELC